MRTKPNTLLGSIVTTATIALHTVTAVCFPDETVPAGKIVLAIVAAKGYPQQRIITVGLAPCGDRVAYLQTINLVQISLASGLGGIRRVKENSGQPVLKCWRRATDARLITAADTHAGQAFG